MYIFKTNKETKKLEMVVEPMNIHSSVIARKSFDDVFSREYARYEYFSLLAKSLNGNANKDDDTKLGLICERFKFDNDTEDYSVFSGIDPELTSLLILTLFAHSKLLESCSEKDGEYRVKPIKMSLKLKEFFEKAKELVYAIETGTKTIEAAVKELKPFYNAACDIVNHEAVEKVCKKWTESTKEKNTRAFLIGLLSKYRLTRTNKLKIDSPLKSQESFERYFAMWLVTEGEIANNKKDKVKSVETFDSFCGRNKKALLKEQQEEKQEEEKAENKGRGKKTDK